MFCISIYSYYSGDIGSQTDSETRCIISTKVILLADRRSLKMTINGEQDAVTPVKLLGLFTDQ